MSKVQPREHRGTVIGPNDMDEIENMEIREDDIFTVSFPRSGEDISLSVSLIAQTPSLSLSHHPSPLSLSLSVTLSLFLSFFL